MLDKIFEKVSRNLPLGEQERQEFLIFLKRTQGVVQTAENWTAQVGGHANLVTPTLNNVNWNGAALKPFAANRLADLTVANDTHTYITFDQVFDGGDALGIEPDNQKIKVAGVGQTYWLQFSGVVQWAPNATGFRVCYVEGFTAADLSLGSGVMHALPGFTGAENWFPYAFLFTSQDFPTLSYFKIRVYQNSGGNLDLKSLSIGIHIA